MLDNNPEPQTSQPPQPSSDSFHIYTNLSIFLRSRTTTAAELDILPSNFSLPNSASPVLIDNSSLGIRKSDLVSAFLVARNILFANGGPPTIPPNQAEAEKLLSATAVILFFDPEHLTAANFRKRYLAHFADQCGYRTPPNRGYIDGNAKARVLEPTNLSARALHRAVRAELALLDSLLTSPLHRHSKSPTLWHHRCWVVSSFVPRVFDQFVPSDPTSRSFPSLHFPPTSSTRSSQPPPSSSSSSSSSSFPPSSSPPTVPFFLTEHTTALHAASRHPANYHAFGYLRKLAQLPRTPKRKLTEDGAAHGAVRRQREHALSLVEGWCFGHPRDISGWAYLVFLLRWGGAWDSGLERERVEGVVRRVGEWRGRHGDWGRGRSVEWFLQTVKTGLEQSHG